MLTTSTTFMILSHIIMVHSRKFVHLTFALTIYRSPFIKRFSKSGREIAWEWGRHCAGGRDKFCWRVSENRIGYIRFMRINWSGNSIRKINHIRSTYVIRGKRILLHIHQFWSDSYKSTHRICRFSSVLRLKHFCWARFV